VSEETGDVAPGYVALGEHAQTAGLVHHPEGGDLETHHEALHLPDTDGQRLLTHTACPGSGSANALRLLAGS
jgi:hypothetical protein